MTNENVLSEQEIFNQVADHLLTQKKKSRDPKTKSCQYRGPNGLKCAVGGILADHEVPFGANNYTVYSIDLPDRLRGRVDFLRALQVVHDQNKPSRWIEKLSAFAKKHKLSTSVLKKYRMSKKNVVMDAPLTKQQIFDKVAVHLLTQKKKSVRTKDMPSYDGPSRTSCAYRTPEGLMCAVGCLITDEEYKNNGEEISARVLARKIQRLSTEQEFLATIQYLHDDNKPSKWINKLSILATAHGLNKDVLKQFRKNAKSS